LRLAWRHPPAWETSTVDCCCRSPRWRTPLSTTACTRQAVTSERCRVCLYRIKAAAARRRSRVGPDHRAMIAGRHRAAEDVAHPCRPRSPGRLIRAAHKSLGADDAKGWRRVNGRASYRVKRTLPIHVNQPATRDMGDKAGPASREGRPAVGGPSRQAAAGPSRMGAVHVQDGSVGH
jgi:hypothetical protein